MKRLITLQSLATLCLLSFPSICSSQVEDDCSMLANDLDGDLVVGVSDIIELLTAFGDNYDIDDDGIADCEDDCVGEYDECEICNGPGPQALAIDTIVITLDSVFVPETGEWLIEVVDVDTLLHLVCENIGCTDPQAENFDPYADPGGECVYPCGLDVLYNGYAYATVEIGNQCWFKENLRTTQYSNGSNIPYSNDCVINGIGWGFLFSPAQAVYGSSGGALMGTCIPCNHFNPDFNACNPSLSLDEYGILYNWYAVTASAGLCPSGWQVPNKSQWEELRDYVLGLGYDEINTPLRSTAGWIENSNGTDDFGFSGRSGGKRAPTGEFQAAGNVGMWWSRTASGLQAYRFRLDADNSGQTIAPVDWRHGFSVRCIQDPE